MIAAGVGLLALIVAAALTLENATFSHGGRVPFSFSYRGLYRGPRPRGVRQGAAPSLGRPAGGLLRGRAAAAAALLRRPLGRAAAVCGGLHQGAGPSATRTSSCAARARPGSTRSPPTHVFYTAVLEGQTMWGRDVLLLPERPGAREGVDIVMLTSPTANSQVKLPTEVGSAGVLLRPLRTFSFG